MNAKVAAWLVSWTQMFLMDSRADWYHSNNHFRFKKGDVIKLKNRMAAGYGIDPIGVVVDCTQEKGIRGGMEDRYIINMNKFDYDSYVGTDQEVNWYGWAKNGRLPKDHKRIAARERHFKWNIEHHFGLCSDDFPEDFFSIEDASNECHTGA